MIILQTLGGGGLAERLARLLRELIQERVECVKQRRLRRIVDIPDLVAANEALIICHGNAGDGDAASLHALENYRTKSIRLSLPDGTPPSIATPNANIVLCYVHRNNKVQHSYSQFAAVNIREWHYAKDYQKATLKLREFISKLDKMERYKGISKAFELLLIKTPSEKLWAISAAIEDGGAFAETIRNKLLSVSDETTKSVGRSGGTQENAEALDYLIARAKGVDDLSKYDRVRVSLTNNEDLVEHTLMALRAYRNKKSREHAAPPLLYQLIGEVESPAIREHIIRDADQYLRACDKKYKRAYLDISDEAIEKSAKKNEGILTTACKKFPSYAKLRRELVSEIGTIKIPGSVFIDRPVRRAIFGIVNGGRAVASGANEWAAAQPIMLGILMTFIGLAVWPVLAYAASVLAPVPASAAKAEVTNEAPNAALELPKRWLQPYAVVDAGAKVSAVAFNRDGTTVLVGDEDGGLAAWGAIDGRSLYKKSVHAGRVLSVSPADGQNVLVTSVDGYVSEVVSADATVLNKWSPYSSAFRDGRKKNGWRDAYVNDASFSGLLFSGGWDGKLFVGQLRDDTGEYQAVNFKSLGSPVLAVEAADDGNSVLVLSGDGVLASYRSADLVEVSSRRIFESDLSLDSATGSGVRYCGEGGDILVQAPGVGFLLADSHSVPSLSHVQGSQKDLLLSCSSVADGYLLGVADGRIGFLDRVTGRWMSTESLSGFGIGAHHARKSGDSCCGARFLDAVLVQVDSHPQLRVVTYATDGRLVLWQLTAEAQKWLFQSRRRVDVSSAS